jgi:hypothetical protein
MDSRAPGRDRPGPLLEVAVSPRPGSKSLETIPYLGERTQPMLELARHRGLL